MFVTPWWLLKTEGAAGLAARGGFVFKKVPGASRHRMWYDRRPRTSTHTLRIASGTRHIFIKGLVGDWWRGEGGYIDSKAGGG